MSKGKVHEYSNDEITVVWKPDLCAHAGECVKGSPGVFRPKERRWIQIEKSDTKSIKETIDNCPSGALSFKSLESLETDINQAASFRIKSSKNGPYLISGNLEIEDSEGNVELVERKTIALCRCGASANKPFCDGSHTDSGFEG